MKAITYSRYGPPEVLSFHDVASPAPKAGEVLIRVRAVEVTKTDTEFRSFRFAVQWYWLPLRLVAGVTRPRRRILGSYFSGEVVAVGSSVTTFAVGDEVFGTARFRMGAYGEYIALPANSPIAPKPVNMSFAEAAAVPLGGLNALHFMRRAALAAGEQVLVIGAGGSIGAHAVQIAKASGAAVTVVDAGHKEDLLRRIGADYFIDYRREDFSDRGQRYDVVFDIVPGGVFAAGIGVLKVDGRYLCGNPTLAVMLRSLLATRFSDKTAICAPAAETRDGLLALKELIEAGNVRSIVDRVFPMQRADEAHRRVETEQRCGAIVLEIGTGS